MKKRTSKKIKADSADAQNRCIWMTAGVISFKLCPFNFDCEHCDFDKAMRSHVRSEKIRAKVKRHRAKTQVKSKAVARASPDSEKTVLFFTFSVGKLEKRVCLHPAHLWALQIEAQKWKVGADKLLAYILPPPAKFEWYDLNKNISQDQVFGRIVTQAGSVPLTIPLSGRLIQTNPKLTQHPELVQQDPYGEGWLATIEWSQKHSELEKFYTGFAGRRFLEEEAQHLKFLLKHRGIEVDQIGDTLRDGGVDIKYLHQVLPAELCLKLAGELIVTGKQTW